MPRYLRITCAVAFLLFGCAGTAAGVVVMAMVDVRKGVAIVAGSFFLAALAAGGRAFFRRKKGQ